MNRRTFTLSASCCSRCSRAPSRSRGETVERLFYQILNEPVNLEPLRQAGVPEVLTQLVSRSTAKKKEDRPQNFTQVCATLESLIREADPRTTAEREAATRTRAAAARASCWFSGSSRSLRSRWPV